VQEALTDPNAQSALDEHLNVIHSNVSSRNLQYLMSEPEPVQDDIQKRLTLTMLYNQASKQRSQILHMHKGLRILVPEEKWINWKTFSPDSQREFTNVAWAQMSQYDKVAMMTALQNSKLGTKPIYIDFNSDTKHDEYWSDEMASVRHYMVELATQYGSYRSYNPLIIEELASTSPLELSDYYDWSSEERPSAVHLPYSGMDLHWDETDRKWYNDSSSKSIGISSDEDNGPPSTESSPSLLTSASQALAVGHGKLVRQQAFIHKNTEINGRSDSTCVTPSSSNNSSLETSPGSKVQGAKLSEVEVRYPVTEYASWYEILD